MTTPEEVRYHMLRPDQVVARRTACPAAYLPIGTIEWHGPQNPLGADTIQAEALAVRCARLGGGLAFPPLYYGESRVEALMEANAADRADIAARMRLPPDNFAPHRHPFSAMEQAMNYHKLLIHMLAELESLGFEVGVLVAGHYPLIDHAISAAHQYNQRKYGPNSSPMLAWACVDYKLVADQFPGSGDHAGGWETSHLMAICPECVDLTLLPARGEKLVGIMGRIPPQDSTAEFGQKTLDAAAQVVIAEVRHRLENKNMYFGHGDAMRTGLWKTSK